MSDFTAANTDDEDDIHVQPVNHNESREELFDVSTPALSVASDLFAQALKDSQLSVVKLPGEVRKLRKENANLLANCSKKARKNAEENQNLLEYQSQVVALAKKVLFTRALVVPITDSTGND